MNPRHAAALALVGWYLLCPPRGAGPGLHFNTQAPLGQWEFVGSDHAFATSAECREEQKKLHGYFTELGGRANIDEFERSLLVEAGIRIDAAQCVSSDDPGLARFRLDAPP
jgi:hypothetical protein